MFRSAVPALGERLSSPTHLIFLVLVVLNLVAGFQALGTLMAVGIMLLPAVPRVSGPRMCRDDPRRRADRLCWRA